MLVIGQSIEPEKIPQPEPKTLLGEGFRNGMGFNIMVNNFGVSLGAQYRHIIGPKSQMYGNFSITGIRNVDEQTFVNFFGQQIIPNKFRRVISMPLTIGFRRRFFAGAVDDNFRFYLGAGAGPAFTITAPYFQDIYGEPPAGPGSGVGDQVRNQNIFFPAEPVNDIFQGWDEAETLWGANGEFLIGVDFGEDFERLSTIQFGFKFFYYPQGIQILEPRRINVDATINNIRQNINDIVYEPFNDKQFFFGTPHITLVFGRMWKYKSESE